MEKELFENDFIEKLNKNFTLHQKYFDFRFYVFCELGGLVFEINKCLILEFSRASITLTNHLLERLLKIALIYKKTGIDSKPTEKWDSIYEQPNNKYSSILLSNSIELCKKYGLITLDEKNYLFEVIRILMRNGFSHADPTEILAGLPDETTVFQASFDNPTEINKININQKIIPTLQTLHLEKFAKENAFSYFDFVYNLIINIENRLIEDSGEKIQK